VTRVAQQFSQGNVDFTGNNLDVAINGEGFFVLHDDAGNVSYTRAGAYGMDRDGYVVNHAGERLQVFQPTDSTGTRFNTGTTVDLVLPAISGTPSATTTLNAALNLSSTETEPALPFDPTNATTYNHSSSTTVYDTLGEAHTMTMYYRRTANAGEWTAYTYIDGNQVTANSPATINFDSNGGLQTSSGSIDASGRMTIAYDPLGTGSLANGASAMNIEFDYNLTTQFGSDFAVNDLTQNGYTAGRLSGIDIDNTGVVFARFTNGQSQALGKIALARFNNDQGLRQLGDTRWAETFTSGDVQLGEAGTSSFGLLQSGALENSNVDIAEQLVGLITAQRNYQANAQVITTADAITQTIINIR
ncbi:MAG TPA: flagellar hook protein FlgE, partial [Chromatiales bacterium]|nr:flagellar hook protein FlgE [Chromatiales bacterium]